MNDIFSKESENRYSNYSMLELFGLQSRVLTKADGISPSDLIDWNPVNEKLEEQRNESMEWLKNSLLKED